MTPKNLLSEAAQRLIDEHREDRLVEESLDALMTDVPVTAAAAPVFVSKAAAKATAPRKPPYTAAAMVQLLIDHPNYSHAEFADYFGYKASWFAGVLVSNNFQAALEERRSEVLNPALSGTMQDMFRAMTVQALVVLQSRLDDPKASEDLIIKAIGAGVKALGMGTPGSLPPEAPTKPSLQQLASNLAAKPQLIEATPARDWAIEASLGELPQ